MLVSKMGPRQGGGLVSGGMALFHGGMLLVPERMALLHGGGLVFGGSGPFHGGGLVAGTLPGGPGHGGGGPFVVVHPLPVPGKGGGLVGVIKLFVPGREGFPGGELLHGGGFVHRGMKFVGTGGGLLVNAGIMK